MYYLNAKPRIEVRTKEYKVVHMQQSMVLYTKNLGDEVACTIFSYITGIGVLSRQVDITQLPQIMNSLNPNNLQLPENSQYN